jgi:tetratricopeptide (TPR) repeat protein
MQRTAVQVWQETVVIPTYGVGEPDKNPMFFENRVYQGSSGVVYPNPVIEKIYDEKTDKEYTGLFIENKYLRIMILPELGGRVQMAYDKIKQRHFVYYNQVIKPALVGLCGPWISGGIEFNWPQHHRPSTFEPLDFSIEENKDGSCTVWINEIEKMFGTKCLTAFTLYPDTAYLEIKARIFNRTSLPQTFLWWANPAVKVNDDYQSVFPPDVHAVFDHGKRGVSDFPIATGTYYKVDYSPGTDISRYKNIPVPTSYMAIHSDYDFLGGYEHDSQGGVLHVADHHVSPGKKQWTWGHSDFGRAWDRNLTDEDGPYIELMAGVYTDNQPDFSWLMPYEEKTFTQYFLPYRELGMVKNANKDLVLNIETNGNTVEIKVQATSSQQVEVKLLHAGTTLFSQKAAIAPETLYTQTVVLPAGADEQHLKLVITDLQGKELLVYSAEKNKDSQVPEPAKPAMDPAEIESNEALFLTGLHLEQYRHATYSPVPYYEEALRRDPSDIRSNNALGLWYFRRGQFSKSEPWFRAAIATLTARNPNPYDGEPYYNLGLALKMQGRSAEAYEAFYKAAWNGAWQHSAYFSLTQLNMLNNDYESALEHISLSLDKNAGNCKAHVLQIAALRKLSRNEEALRACETALRRDGFNLAVYFEQALLYHLMDDGKREIEAVEQLMLRSRENEVGFVEYALDYADAGLFEEAISLLELLAGRNNARPSRMLWYYLAWMHMSVGDSTSCDECLDRAAKTPAAYFTNKLQDIAVLTLAAERSPKDEYAPYCLGNLWYDKRQYTEAVDCWKKAADRSKKFATIYRNLGIAFFNKQKDIPAAVQAYEKAFSIDNTDARVLMELDQLYKRLNREPAERLVLLEQHLAVVNSRDDLYLERAALYNFLGVYDKAFELISSRKFHPWEGGEGKVSAQYCYSLVEMAKQKIRDGKFRDAIALLDQARVYPHNLGEGKLFGAQENDIFFWIACAFEELGDVAAAKSFFLKATQGSFEPAAAIVYNDQQPDKIFYQGLAFQKLGDHERASKVFNGLVNYGNEHLNDKVRVDYFAVSLPDLLIFEDDFSKRNRIHCHYMTGLGLLGLQDFKKAKDVFRKGLQEDAMHFGCKTHLRLATQMEGKGTVLQPQPVPLKP